MPAAKKLFTTIAVLLFLTGAAGFAAEPEKDTAEIQLNFPTSIRHWTALQKNKRGFRLPRRERRLYCDAQFPAKPNS